jgi:hypothetical protein
MAHVQMTTSAQLMNKGYVAETSLINQGLVPVDQQRHLHRIHHISHVKILVEQPAGLLQEAIVNSHQEEVNLLFQAFRNKLFSATFTKPFC